MELALDRGHVGEDVRVVVFEIVEDRDARTVVHELRALVEERGVVLVRFDHERLAPPQPSRHPALPRHPRSEEPRVGHRVFSTVRSTGSRVPKTKKKKKYPQ